MQSSSLPVLDIKGPHFMLIVSLTVTAIGLVIAFLALKVVAISRKSALK